MLKRISHFANVTNISLIFIGLMFLLPAINMHHEVPVTSFYSEWIAGVFGLAALLPMLGKASWSSMRIPQISLVFLGLAVILGVQWAIGMLHSTHYALLILSYLSWAFLLALLGCYLRRELGWIRLVNVLALFLIIAGIINGGMMVLQIVTRTGGAIPFLPNLSSYGPFAQENHFADFIALATASLIYLYAKGRFSTAFFTLILIWFLLMLAVSGSRSSWLYLTAFALLAFIMQAKSIKQKSNASTTRTLLYACLALLPLFALTHIFAYQIAPEGLFKLTTDRIVNGINIDTPSARTQIWYDSLRLFWQSPWLGIGAGKINAESFLLMDNPTALSANRIFENSHNLFLHLLTEMGIGAFLISLACITTWFRNFKWRELTPETWWLISLITILSIHSMLEYPLWYAYFLGIAAFLLGAGDEKVITINATITANKLTTKVMRGGLAILLVLGALNLATMLAAHNTLATAIYQSPPKDEKALQQELGWISHYTLLSPYAELLFAVSMKIDHNDIDRQIALNQSAINFRPFSKTCYQQVVLLKLKGDDVNAKKLLNRTLIVYPDNMLSIVEPMPARYRKEFLTVLNEVNPALAADISAQINKTPGIN